MVCLETIYWSFITKAQTSECVWIRNSAVHHNPNDYSKWVVGLY